MSTSTAIQKRAERFRAALEKRADELQRALPAHIEADHFIEVAITAYLDTPKLQECEPMSVYRALRRAARFGLRPDGEEGAVIPYRDKDSGDLLAEFQPMFKGVVRSLLRTGAVKKVEARVVKTGDQFEYHFGLSPDLRHVPASSDRQGEISHAYAIATFPDADKQFEVMDRDQLDRVRRAAKASNSPAWTQWHEEMCRKAVVKRLSKYLEVDSTVAALVRWDDSMEASTGHVPQDFMPERDTRALSERATHHAQRQTEDLKARLANDESEAADDGGAADATGTAFDLNVLLERGQNAIEALARDGGEVTMQESERLEACHEAEEAEQLETLVTDLEDRAGIEPDLGM